MEFDGRWGMGSEVTGRLEMAIGRTHEVDVRNSDNLLIGTAVALWLGLGATLPIEKSFTLDQNILRNEQDSASAQIIISLLRGIQDLYEGYEASQAKLEGDSNPPSFLFIKASPARKTTPYDERGSLI
ncbi:cytochrome b6-f complex subunit 4 [Striga asiatica]|uniref:Cytochrome b6-f complex subunit 4 n=1 Tax=Striga asiatica TaxID=4170 RepID=A0A5A7Q071_STRAF|nr:cytochrome b6-f complex subunit 4 [Striga asiatica]